MASKPPSSGTNSSSMGAGRTPDTGSWIHGCFVVRVGTDFKSYKQLMEYALADDVWGGKGKPQVPPSVKKIIDSSPGAENSPLPIYFSQRKCRDSSLGGNDSINPLPQFSLDDDIAPPNLSFDTRAGFQNVSMGQVYSENYDDLQQILYLGFGIPLFTDLGSFWGTATDMDLANFVNKGGGITPEKLGYLIGSAPIRIINIATIPFKFIGAVTDSLQRVPISKYYSFSSEMPMYFRFVNTILVMLATNMGLMGAEDNLPSTGSKTSDKSQIGLLKEGTKKGPDLSGMNSIWKDFGLDMAQIMTKRFLYENGNRDMMKKRWTDSAIELQLGKNNGEGTTPEAADPNQSTNPDANQANSDGTPPDIMDTFWNLSRKWTTDYFDKFQSGFKGAFYDGHLFIGFRIDKGMGGSESFSNTTGESQIAQLANEKFQAGREASFQTMHGEMGQGRIAGAIEGAIGMAKGILEGAFQAINMDPLAATMMGKARIDIPEVWMSSNWSRSASFSITCLAPYGDFESIFQSEYVPLACILAGTLPRGTGLSSHSSPFICQAYCRGVFSSPLCIIESLEVTRGADQFGMNAARLPLKLTMNVTLKDLTPVMYMSMGADQGILNAMMGTDDNFGEYMLTLSGMGLRDRLSPWRHFRRKITILLSTTFKNNKFLNPYMLGMDTASKFPLMRLISTFADPGRNLPGN